MDIFNDIENVTHRWQNYNNVNGWNLMLRFNCAVEGYDGNLNEYFAETTLKSTNTHLVVVQGPQNKLQFFVDHDLDGVYDAEVNGIAKDEGVKTLVRSTYTGDFSSFPTGMVDNYGYLFYQELGGSIFSRRFASTEIPSEEGSPWEATAADPMATTSRADGNVRINTYGTGKIVIESYFDPTNFKDEEYHIFPKLGYKAAEQLLLLEDNSPILLSTGEGLAINV